MPRETGLCSFYSPTVSVRTTFNPIRSRYRARIVTWPNLSVPVNGEIVRKCRIGLFGRWTICSWMREAVLKLSMEYKMTKHVFNNGTLNGSRTWLLVRTWHCYFISFNSEHPVFLELPPQVTSLSTKFMHERGGVPQLDKYPFNPIPLNSPAGFSGAIAKRLEITSWSIGFVDMKNTVAHKRNKNFQARQLRSG